MMKLFLLMLLSVLGSAVGQSQSCSLECPLPLYFGDPNCNAEGFKIKDNKFFNNFRELNDGSTDTNRTFSNDCEFKCCAPTEGDCCKDYPAGYWVAFVIGIGGVALMILFVIYQCYCAKSEEPVKAKKEAEDE